MDKECSFLSHLFSPFFIFCFSYSSLLFSFSYLYNSFFLFKSVVRYKLYRFAICRVSCEMIDHSIYSTRNLRRRLGMKTKGRLSVHNCPLEIAYFFSIFSSFFLQLLRVPITGFIEINEPYLRFQKFE